MSIKGFRQKILRVLICVQLYFELLIIIYNSVLKFRDTSQSKYSLDHKNLQK